MAALQAPALGTGPPFAGGAHYLGIGNVHKVVLVSELKMVNVERGAQSFQGLWVAMKLFQCQLVIGSPGKSF